MLPGNVNLKSYLCHQSSDDGFSTPQPLLMIGKKQTKKKPHNNINKMFKKRKREGINSVKGDFAPNFGVLISARIELFQNLLSFLMFSKIGL